MLRARLLLQRARQVASEVSHPLKVLGASPHDSFDDIRHRFQELAQRYHPDKPEGDPVKFREINAAYRQLRAEYRNSKTPGHKKGSFNNGSSREHSYAKESQSTEDFWAARNQQVREEWERSQAQRRREEAEFKKTRTGLKKPSPIRRCLTFFYNYEIFLSVGTLSIVIVCGIERYWTVKRMLAARDRQLRNMDEGLPPPMPLELDDKLVKKYSEPPTTVETRLDATRIREESSYRRATQRRFDDFREFMYVYDAEGVAVRKIRTSRFSYQYVKESAIPKQCPIVRAFNSDVKGQGYPTIEKELSSSLHDTPWVVPDAAVAGSLVAKGLGCIPVNSPNTAKWTFIEYVDLDGKNGANTTPVCLAAIRNDRFDKVGMCQRVTVAGKGSLQPQLLDKRKEDLKSGALRKKQLVSPGVLPLSDLSIPLREMKL